MRDIINAEVRCYHPSGRLDHQSWEIDLNSMRCRQELDAVISTWLTNGRGFRVEIEMMDDAGKDVSIRCGFTRSSSSETTKGHLCEQPAA